MYNFSCGGWGGGCGTLRCLLFLNFFGSECCDFYTLNIEWHDYTYVPSLHHCQLSEQPTGVAARRGFK